METQLNGMSNEALWQLFPILLTEHDPAWAGRYEVEADGIVQMVGAEHIRRIRHIGSTAVVGLIAKPTIDVLLEISESTDILWLKDTFAAAGYMRNDIPKNPPPHVTFLKGYTPRGFEGQAFHIHVRYPGDWDEPIFCAYLARRPQVAAEYGALKRALLAEYRHDRDGYTEAKGAFVRRVTAEARNEAGSICQKSTDCEGVATHNER